jgi:microcystin-dependent protein
MSQPFIGEIRMTGFGFAPKDWAMCNGQMLQINANQALFSVLGTSFGGDGRTTFGLPDMRGRVPMHWGTRQNGSTVALGERAGEEGHTLTIAEIPSHAHGATANASSANQANAASNFWGNSKGGNYAAAADGFLDSGAVVNTGNGQAHENRAPFQVVNYMISLRGIFPSRS